MKKVFLAILMGVMITSCTENNRVKNWGGLGTMGFALPAAIGAKFGALDRTVIKRNPRVT